MQQRQLIQEQINGLLKKATQRPGAQDDMGMVGFMSVLIAAKMQSLLLQQDMEPEEPEEAQEKPL